MPILIYLLFGLLFVAINWGVVRTRKNDSLFFWPLVAIDIVFILIVLLTTNFVCGHVETSGEMVNY